MGKELGPPLLAIHYLEHVGLDPSHAEFHVASARKQTSGCAPLGDFDYLRGQSLVQKLNSAFRFRPHSKARCYLSEVCT
jgi:hypothetical protein